MPTYTEITPRELRPALLELDGISRASIEAHYRLYQGYVAKRNEILGEARGRRPLGREPGLLRAPRAEGRSQLRDRRDQEPRDLLRAPRRRAAATRRRVRGAVERDFGSVDAWRDDLKATGIAGRGWAWTAYDWDEGRLFNYIGDAQNTFPVWNATPLVALDVYEHAYFLDFQTDRASYIDAFFANLDWGVVNGWVASYGIPRVAVDAHLRRAPGRPHRRRRLPRRLDAVRRRGRAAASAARTSARRAAATSARRTSGAPTALARRAGGAARVLKGFVPAFVGLRLGGEWVGVLAGSAAMLGHARPIWLGFTKGGKMVATGGGVALALAPIGGGHLPARLDRRVRALPVRVACVDRDRARAADPLRRCSASRGRPWRFAAVAALAVILLHRQNIGRLLHGTESRFSRAADPAATP